jgi:hypothetical protein
MCSKTSSSGGVAAEKANRVSPRSARCRRTPASASRASARSSLDRALMRAACPSGHPEAPLRPKFHRNFG